MAQKKNSRNDKFNWKKGDVQIFKNTAEAEKALGGKFISAPQVISKKKKK